MLWTINPTQRYHGYSAPEGDPSRELVWTGDKIPVTNGMVSVPEGVHETEDTLETLSMERSLFRNALQELVSGVGHYMSNNKPQRMIDAFQAAKELLMEVK